MPFSIVFDTAVTVFSVFRLLLDSLQTALLAANKAPLHPFILHIRRWAGLAARYSADAITRPILPVLPPTASTCCHRRRTLPHGRRTLPILP